VKNYKKKALSLTVNSVLMLASLNALAIDIPVHFIVAATNHDGTNAKATVQQMDDAITELNNQFNTVDLDIDFNRNSITYLTNNDVSGFNGDWSTSDEEDVRAWFKEGSLNIIVANLDGLNGHAYWDYEEDNVIEVHPNNISVSTIAHEFGHNMSLKHTYQSYDVKTIKVMEGNSGWKYGDYVIDTKVDPGDRSLFDNCVYEGDAKDSDGTLYQPDGLNVMGKGQNTCRTLFSEQQRQRMKRVLLTNKYYLYDKFGQDNNGNGLHPTCNSAAATINTFPHHEGFNFNVDVSDKSWVQDIYNDANGNWKIAISSSTSSTGANSAAEGRDFIHIDASSSLLNNGDSVSMLSPCYDVENENKANVQFKYSMYGSNIGELKLEVTTDNGVTWSQVWNKKGAQHNNGNTWSTANVDLNNYAGNKIQLRLRGIVDGSKGDISVDDISFSVGEPDQTVTLRVAHKHDDAEERLSTNAVGLESSDLELVDENGTREQNVGIRFVKAGIPADVEIVSATLRFTVDATNSGATSLTIHGEDTINSARFEAVASNISNRVLTDASVAWKPGSWSTVGDSGAAQTTPSLITILQEMVDLADWSTDSAVTFIISGDGEREAESFDGGSSNNLQPVLSVTYKAKG
jgi:hypothetical protein